MNFELFIGTRFLKAKPKEKYLSLITIISVLGILVGVMALTVVLSVMNGFRTELLSKILGITPHILVFHFDGMIPEAQSRAKEILGIKGVEAVSPFIYSQVMVNHRGSSSGALLYGIDPDTIGSVLKLGPMLSYGSFHDLLNKRQDIPQVIVGKELAAKMGIVVGDIVSVMAPEGKKTPLGRAPNTVRFVVAGLFESGLYEYDLSLIYVNLKEAQDLLGVEGLLSGLQVRVTDYDKADQIAAHIAQTLGKGYWTKDWKKMNKNFFAALKLEKITMFVILAMIIMVGSLNIVSGLVMLVMEKKRSIAILRAMGASSRSIIRIFLYQGLIQGVLGTLCGTLLGLGLCYLLKRYKFISLPADVYPIGTLPVHVQVSDILFVSSCAIALSLTAAIYPALQASRQNPLDILRYE